MRIYYLSKDGDDDNDGLTPVNAWRSIDRLNAHLRDAVQADDYFLFEGGSEFIGDVECFLISPWPRGLTFGSYGFGRAILNATEIGLWYCGPGELTIRDLIFRGPGVRNLASRGLRIDAGHGTYDGAYTGPAGNISLRRIEISGFHFGVVSQPGTELVRNFTWENVNVHHNGGAGAILGYGGAEYPKLLHDLVIRDSQFSDNSSPLTTVQGAEFGGTGLNILGASGVRIERSQFDRNGASIESWGRHGLGIEWSERVTVCDSQAIGNYDASPEAWDGQGMFFHACMYVLVERNYIAGNGGGGIMVMGQYGPCANVTVRHNLIERNQIGLLLADGAVPAGSDGEFTWPDQLPHTNIHVYHNTLHNRYADVAFQGYGGDAFLANNELTGTSLHVQSDEWTERRKANQIWFGSNLYSSPLTALRWAHANLWAVTDTLAEWRALGHEREQRPDGTIREYGAVANPRFVAPGQGPMERALATVAYRRQMGAPARLGLDLRQYDLDPGEKLFDGRLLPAVGPLVIGFNCLVPVEV